MNTFDIQQSAEETKLAVMLHQNAAISSIRLARCNSHADPPNQTEKGSIHIEFEFASEPVEETADALRIGVNFHLTGSQKLAKAKPRQVLSIECAFEITYGLRPGFKPTVEQIDAFKDGNAIFNCWPYFRQHLQETVVNMGYPPLTLPFLRVVTKRPKPAKALKQP